MKVGPLESSESVYLIKLGLARVRREERKVQRATRVIRAAVLRKPDEWIEEAGRPVHGRSLIQALRQLEEETGRTLAAVTRTRRALARRHAVVSGVVGDAPAGPGKAEGG